MKKILILANHFITIYAYRKEFIKKLLDNEYEVYLSLPKSDENKYFINLGCKIIDTPIERRGTNPISDIKLLFNYIRLIKKIKPSLILTYTIKPNIYGGIAARILKADAIHTVTGLGSVYIQDMWQKKITIFLNKIAFKSASRIFFLNNDNKNFYKDLGIVRANQKIIIVPGSGVNLNEFRYKEQPDNGKIIFTFIGRILKDKGIEEFLSAAKEIVSDYNNVEFKVVGFVDDKKYINLIKEYESNGVIDYLGKRNDIPNIMEKSSCIVLPSYGEGRGTVLQEGAAVGRPLITTDTYGCRDNVDDGYNGFLCKKASTSSLVNAMKKFIELSPEEKIEMGKKSRDKAENEFDRNIVVNTYINEVNDICRNY